MSISPDSPALILGSLYLYWHGIFMACAIALGIAAALLLAGWLRPRRPESPDRTLPVFDTALTAIPLALVLSHLLYCVSNFEEYHSIGDVLRFSEGGYGLYGAMLGVFLAAVIQSRLHRGQTDYALGALCDCLAAGGALGIAAGRLTGVFSMDNVGMEMTRAALCHYPLSVYDPSAGHWFLATYRMEAVAELIIFGLLCALPLRKGRNGDTALLFLLLHGAAEVAFDSMQTDALRFPGNSFVMMQQVIGAFSLLAVMTVLVLRSVKQEKKCQPYHIVSSGVYLALIGVAAWMEFDRISDTNYFRNHGVMLLAMICAAAIGLAMYRTTLSVPRDEEIPEKIAV